MRKKDYLCGFDIEFYRGNCLITYLVAERSIIQDSMYYFLKIKKIRSLDTY